MKTNETNVTAFIDPARIKAAQQALPESYGQLTKSLTQIKCKDVYDFLSRDPSNGAVASHYDTTDDVSSLIARAKQLNAAYRNIPDATEKAQTANLVATFLEEGHKEKYDTFVSLGIRALLCRDIDGIMEFDDELNTAKLDKLTSKFTRLYFPPQKVQAFIQDYCNHKGYAVSSGIISQQELTQPQAPPKPTTPHPSAKEVADTESKPPATSSPTHTQPQSATQPTEPASTKKMAIYITAIVALLVVLVWLTVPLLMRGEPPTGAFTIADMNISSDADESSITEDMRDYGSESADTLPDWGIAGTDIQEQATPAPPIMPSVTSVPEYVTIQGEQFSTSLTELDLWLLTDEDIKPIRYMTNLRRLDLTTSYITDITPLAGLTNLIELHLDYNSISDITPLAGLTSLTCLGIGHNQITDITPLAGLTNLTDLWLMRNQITDISPLAGLTNLADVNLEYNPVINWSPVDHVEIVRGRPLTQTQQDEHSTQQPVQTWQEAYVNFLRNPFSFVVDLPHEVEDFDSFTFALRDMTGDGIPELLIYFQGSFGAIGCGFLVYTFHGNGIRLLDSIGTGRSWGNISVSNHTGFPGLFFSWMHMDIFFTGYVEFVDGQFVTTEVEFRDEQGAFFDVPVIIERQASGPIWDAWQQAVHFPTHEITEANIQSIINNW